MGGRRRKGRRIKACQWHCLAQMPRCVRNLSRQTRSSPPRAACSRDGKVLAWAWMSLDSRLRGNDNVFACRPRKVFSREGEGRGWAWVTSGFPLSRQWQSLL